MEVSFRVAEEVRAAVADGRAVVALETSVVAHGLPAPANVEAALRCAAAVRRAGALPAFTGVVDGRIVAGLSDAELERLAAPVPVAKAQARDLAALAVAGRSGGTTVSGTLAIAARAGIAVMATGGIGGVHRVATQGAAAGARDVSADLGEIARQRVCVVCSGPKAILDLPATAEVLETLGVPVVGFRTDRMPAFYVDGTAVSLEHRVEDAARSAALLALHWDTLGRPEGVLLFVEPPAPLPPGLVEAAVAAALVEAEARGVGGKAVTPFLLAAVARVTGGDSVRANLALLERNAGVAGEVAAALAAQRKADMP